MSISGIIKVGNPQKEDHHIQLSRLRDDLLVRRLEIKSFFCWLLSRVTDPRTKALSRLSYESHGYNITFPNFFNEQVSLHIADNAQPYLIATYCSINTCVCEYICLGYLAPSCIYYLVPKGKDPFSIT